MMKLLRLYLLGSLLILLLGRAAGGSVFFRWFDLWVGVFVDRKNKTLYICPLPTIGTKIGKG